MAEKPWTVGEVAKTLGVASQSLRNWCDRGKGPKHRTTPGGTRLFDPDDVRKWLESCEPQNKTA